jgi:hypothetical protein
MGAKQNLSLCGIPVMCGTRFSVLSTSIIIVWKIIARPGFIGLNAPFGVSMNRKQ